MSKEIIDPNFVTGVKEVRMRLSESDIAKLPQYLRDKIQKVKKQPKKLTPNSWITIGIKPDGTLVRHRAKEVYDEFYYIDKKNKGESE